MTDPVQDFRATWISDGKRYGMSIVCNCAAGSGHQACMDACEAGFNDDVAAMKVLHPEDP